MTHLALTGVGGAGGSGSPVLPSTNLVLHLKADTGTFQDAAGSTPATSDADPIGKWEDQSGNANHATQATSAAKPTLKLSIVNSLPVIRFDGTDDWLGIADTAVLEMDTDSTVLVVLKPASFDVTNPRPIISKDAGGAAAGAYFFQFSNSDGKPLLDRPFVEAGVKGTASPGTTDFAILSCVVSGTAVSHFLNGSANGTDTLATGTATNVVLRIAQFIGGATFYLPGDIAEIVIYNAALSTSNREAAEEYLNDRYGIF